MSIFDPSTWIPRWEAEVRYVMVVYYFANGIFKTRESEIRDASDFISVEENNFYTRVVRLQKRIIHGDGMVLDSVNISLTQTANAILEKDEWTGWYKVIKSRAPSPYNACYASIRDFEDVMGI